MRRRPDVRACTPACVSVSECVFKNARAYVCVGVRARVLKFHFFLRRDWELNHFFPIKAFVFPSSWTQTNKKNNGKIKKNGHIEPNM